MERKRERGCSDRCRMALWRREQVGKQADRDARVRAHAEAILLELGPV